MRVVRLTFLASLFLALLLLAGCESSNKGKIVGKWECADPSSMAADLKGTNVQVFMEFTADQKFSMTAVVPGILKKDLTTGTYQLGMGDTVTLDGLSPPIDGKTKSRESISIVGDELRLKQDKGPTVLFKRFREPTTAGSGTIGNK
jgi:hypothetical protein